MIPETGIRFEVASNSKRVPPLFLFSITYNCFGSTFHQEPTATHVFPATTCNGHWFPLQHLFHVHPSTVHRHISHHQLPNHLRPPFENHPSNPTNNQQPRHHVPTQYRPQRHLPTLHGPSAHGVGGRRRQPGGQCQTRQSDVESVQRRHS